ncbi:adenosine kinase-like isoform X2 [Daphnia pulex]|uniref:adenosine kinase-like isoform X2 n=1 Tax=Daphnia pulex TaxID=6669 RepID=UPI001EDF1778|nr:adenosine kinase-like isoform X2 [Daphnia pulex]XP_046441514.1 adenosine kinase-like isoform X2 [Daphnia pulex]
MSEENKTLREGMLVGLCNPLLDISAAADVAFLEKYDLQLNNAILAEEKHKPLYKELVSQYKVDYIAGGSGQNALRVAQKVLEKPNTTVFMGCVGKDEYSEILETKARSEGVNVRYQYTESESTGTCAVLLTENGANRSLCANLAAANLFTKHHIEIPENRKFIDEADFFYITGFFLTVNPDTIMEVARHANAQNKTLMMNLSAPFLSQFFKEPMMQTFPYIDILFGNETEAETFAKEQNLPVNKEDMSEIALSIAALPKENKNRNRIVIITQGKDDVIIAQDGKITRIPAISVPSEKIVDTNGAGDAFVGGFISQILQGRPIDVCARCGVWAATQIIQQDGCTFPKDLQIPEEFRSV